MPSAKCHARPRHPPTRQTQRHTSRGQSAHRLTTAQLPSTQNRHPKLGSEKTPETVPCFTIRRIYSKYLNATPSSEKCSILQSGLDLKGLYKYTQIMYIYT